MLRLPASPAQTDTRLAQADTTHVWRNRRTGHDAILRGGVFFCALVVHTHHARESD